MTKPIITAKLVQSAGQKGRVTVAQPIDTCSIFYVPPDNAIIFCNHNVSSDALTSLHLSPLAFFSCELQTHSHKCFQKGGDIEVHKDWNKQALWKYEKKGSE